MARIKGQFGFVGNFDTKINAPLDAREIVLYYADLILSSTWEGVSVYKGMVVSCLDKIGSLYQLNDEDYTKESSWTLISDSSETIDEINSTIEQIKSEILNTLNTHVNNTDNPHKVTKKQLELENVTNDAQVKRSEMGVAKGVATLDENGTIPASQLPSFVDDVLEYNTLNDFPAGGEAGKIYVALDTNLTYRWSGSTYIEISQSLALGETSSTAYAGDKGADTTSKLNSIRNTSLSHINDTNTFSTTTEKVNLNFDCYVGDQYGSTGTSHSVSIPVASATQAGIITATDKIAITNMDSTYAKLTNVDSKVEELQKAINDAKKAGTDAQSNIDTHKADTTNPHNVTKAQVGLGNVDNTSDLDKPISTKTQTALTLETEDRIAADEALLKTINQKTQLQSSDNTIIIDSSDLKVNIDNNTIIKSETGVLQVDAENLPIETGGVDLTKTILVAGGPLASLLNALNITEIPKEDMNMLKLLELLFTKEIYPSVTFKEATLSNSISIPSTFNLASKTVEVNTVVTIPACSNTTPTSSSSNRTLSGFTYGYSIDGLTKTASTSIYKSVSNITFTGDYTLTRTIKGTKETKSGSNVALDATTMTVTKGTNSVVLSITGAKAQGTVDVIPSVYILSNLLNTRNDLKTTEYASATIAAPSAPTASKTITFTGVYPIYATTSNISTLTKQSLITSKTFELNLVSDSDTEAARFALLENEVISSIQIYNPLSGKYDSYNKDNFKQSTGVTLQSGGINTSYILYTRDEGAKAGDSKFKITIQ